jgi:CRP-like cAMP-binding protein
VRVLEVGDPVYRQGEPAEHLYSVMSGWVALHQDLPGGRSQISGFLLTNGVFGHEPDGFSRGHSATALTSASVCVISNTALDRLRRDEPALNERFIRMLQHEVRRGIADRTSLGQGDAKQRMASLLWELAVRVSGRTDLVAGAQIKIPLTQRHLADATGLTTIHVNRVLRRLREKGLAEFHAGVLTVLDPDKLSAGAKSNDEMRALWNTVDAGPDSTTGALARCG